MIKNINKLIRNPSKIKRIPFILTNRVSREYYSWKNYLEFLKSGKSAIYGDLPCDENIIHSQFCKEGYPPIDYTINDTAFRDYCFRHQDTYRVYKDNYGDLFLEKALEHYISLSFSNLNEKSKVIDIANAGSPFPEIVHNEFGCNVWSNDLIFPKGVHKKDWYIRIGGDASQLPIDDNYFDLAVLHCALEMFENDSDIKLFIKADKILKPGGQLVIIPLYMNQTYHILRDPKSQRKTMPIIDGEAELIYRHNFYNIAFARFYNVNALMKRLVANVPNLVMRIFRVRNVDYIDSNCYLKWIAIFEKQHLND